VCQLLQGNFNTGFSCDNRGVGVGTSPKTTIEIKLKQKSTTKTNSAQIIKIKQK
jgi:hypothetical protein